MATYQYRCVVDGVIDVAAPIGTAVPEHPCPVCGGAAVRIFSAPMLKLAPRRLVGAIDRAERSRHEPVVVSAPPGSRRRGQAQAAPYPASALLPRP